MRGRTRGMVAVAITSLALVATACGGGGTEPEPGTSQPAGQAGGEISIRSCTPQNPLIPANTNEVCGGNLLDAIDAKLVHYNADTAAPELDIAESTARQHLSGLYRRIGCLNGAQAAYWLGRGQLG